MDRIPVAGPWITQKEIDYVTDAAEHAWYENANMYHERFEKAFSHYIGTKYSMALPDCTSAIHCSGPYLDRDSSTHYLCQRYTGLCRLR